MTKIDLSEKVKQLKTMRKNEGDLEQQITELKTQCCHLRSRESQTEKDIESEVTKLILVKSKEGNQLKKQILELKEKLVTLQESN